MRVTLEGDKELKAALANMSKRIEDEMSDLVMDTAAGIEAGVKLRIQQGDKMGRVYTRGGVKHQASAPGQAPASDTGELVGSIYHERESELTATTGSRLSKAAMLEYGTAKIAPRPAWTPEREVAEDDFRKDAERILSRVVR